MPKHCDPYALWYLTPECFEDTTRRECVIRAATLLDRLPQVIAVVQHRERVLYGSSDSDTAEVIRYFRDFVDLCERKERETGEPVMIGVSY